METEQKELDFVLPLPLASLEDIGLELDDQCSKVSETDPSNVSVLVPIQTGVDNPAFRALESSDLAQSPSPFLSQMSSPVSVDKKMISMYSPRVEPLLSPMHLGRTLRPEDFQQQLPRSMVSGNPGDQQFMLDGSSCSLNSNISLTQSNISALQQEHLATLIEDLEAKEEQRVGSSLVCQLAVCCVCILMLWASSFTVVSFVVSNDVQVPSASYVGSYLDNHKKFINSQLEQFNVCMADAMTNCRETHSDTMATTKIELQSKQISRTEIQTQQKDRLQLCDSQLSTIVAQAQQWQKNVNQVPMENDQERCTSAEYNKAITMVQRDKYPAVTVEDAQFQVYRAQVLAHNAQAVNNATAYLHRQQTYLQKVKDSVQVAAILPSLAPILTAQGELPNLSTCSSITTCGYQPQTDIQSAYAAVQDFMNRLVQQSVALTEQLVVLRAAAEDLTTLVNFIMSFKDAVADLGLSVPFISAPSIPNIDVSLPAFPAFNQASFQNTFTTKMSLFAQSVKQDQNRYADTLQTVFSNYLSNWNDAALVLKTRILNQLDAFSNPVVNLRSSSSVSAPMDRWHSEAREARLQDIEQTQKRNAAADRKLMYSSQQAPQTSTPEPEPPFQEYLSPRTYSLPPMSAQSVADLLDRIVQQLIASDVFYRCVNTVLFVARQMSRGFADPPVLDVRHEKEDRPSLQSRIINQFFSQFLIVVAGVIIGAIVLILFLDWYSDAVNTYRHGCVFSNAGTGLAKTTSSLSYKYYESSAVVMREQAGLGFVAKRADDCQAQGAEYYNDDKAYQQALANNKADLSILSAEIETLHKCVLWDQMDTVLAQQVNDAVRDCGSGSINAAPFSTVYASTAYDDCAYNTSSCEEMCVQLSRDEMLTSSRASVCVAEWFLYTILLDVLLKIALFILLNLARICLSSFLCRFFWKQLGQGKMFILSRMFCTGTLDEDPDKQGVPESLPDTVSSHKRYSILLLIIGVLAPLPYFILLNGRFSIPPPAAIN